MNVEEGEAMPFILICGPPGTGKTHTIRGILNVWHLTYYQRYFTSLVASAKSRFVSAIHANFPYPYPSCSSSCL